VEAIRDIVSSLPADGPPVLVAQHIPPGFSRAFAVRLDELSLAHVSEAVNGTPVEPGNVYVAPGDFHLTVAEIRGTLCLRVLKTERVNRHRPSVDVLMQSLADVVGERAVGVLLTGMGTDGAQGLLAMRRRGGATIAQDEASSVVWGMPGEAVRLGAASEVLPLGQVLDRLLEASCA
jgi:two-component system chemotaxis response regulator CheB